MCDARRQLRALGAPLMQRCAQHACFICSVRNMRVLSVPRSQCMHITYGRQPNASTTYVPFYICTLFDYVGCVDGSSECLLYAHRGIRNIIFVYPHVVVLFAQLRESCPQACGVCRPPTTVALAHSFAFFPIDYRIRDHIAACGCLLVCTLASRH